MRIISGIAKGTRLVTLEGTDTRPTLDRIKEALFSIIQDKLLDSIVLDLFSGSGALALESISRGAKKAILCDESRYAIEIIKKNIAKTHFEEKVTIYKEDYKKCINKITNKIDIVFIDPPYKSNIAIDATQRVLKNDILSKDGIIIIETDDLDREIQQLQDKEIEIYNIKSYGRVKLIFLRKKERG